MEANKPRLNPQSTWLEVAMGVVLLLGLSMAALPQLSKAAGEGRLATLSDTLHLIRCTIDIYRSQHEGRMPGQRQPGEPVLPAAFVQDLTSPDANGNYPYFKEFPANPFISSDERRTTVTCVQSPSARPDGTEGTAWWFNSATGEFKACDDKFHTAY